MELGMRQSRPGELTMNAYVNIEALDSGARSELALSTSAELSRLLPGAWECPKQKNPDWWGFRLHIPWDHRVDTMWEKAGASTVALAYTQAAITWHPRAMTAAWPTMSDHLHFWASHGRVQAPHPRIVWEPDLS